MQFFSHVIRALPIILKNQLVALIISQDPANTIDPNTMVILKSDMKKRNRQLKREQAQTIYDQLFHDLQQCMELSSEKGSSSWLSVLALEEHGFYPHKGEFRDALCLRYGWRPTNMAQLCNCGTQFTVDHAMICHMGVFPTICHNEIRDIIASLLTEVCHNVATEPALQPLTGEKMIARTANSDEGARLDIRARGFWNRAQDAFFDVSVFFTQTHLPTVPLSHLQPTGDMSRPKSVNMASGSMRLKEVYLHHLYSPQQVA